MPSEMMDRIASIINQHKHTHDEYPLARLILTAMREPSEEMRDALTNAINARSQENAPLLNDEDIYRVMIDGAISGFPPSAPHAEQ